MSSVQRCHCFPLDLDRIATNYLVGPHLNCDWAFSVFTQGQTGDAQNGCLFLDASRVGQNETRGAVETQKIEIAERFDQSEAFHVFDSLAQPEFRDCFSGPGVYRENYGNC